MNTANAHAKSVLNALTDVARDGTAVASFCQLSRHRQKYGCRPLKKSEVVEGLRVLSRKGLLAAGKSYDARYNEARAFSLRTHAIERYDWMEL